MVSLCSDLSGETMAGDLRERERVMLTATAPEFVVAPTPERAAKIKAYRGFDVPWLKWGSQRYLRCLKVNPGQAGVERRSVAARPAKSRIASPRGSDSESEPRSSKDKRKWRESAGGGEKSEIASVREKLMHDLKEAAYNIEQSMLGGKIPAAQGDNGDYVSAAAAAGEEDERRLNQRPRRVTYSKSWRAEDEKVNPSPPPADDQKRSDAVLGSRRGSAVERNKREVVRFSVQLTRKEIEKDFKAILGRGPYCRPKKRPKHVQQYMDQIFPGLLLRDKISADDYKVPQ